METVTVSDSREITLPPSVVNSLGFEPGVLLKVEVEGGRIELVPVREREASEGPDAPPGDALAPGEEDDPLLALSGTIHTEFTDVAERHDDYLGWAQFEDLQGMKRV